MLPPVVVIKGPDNSRAARDRDGAAEQIVRRRVGGGEFLLLGPHPARARKDVGRAGVGAPVVVALGPDDGHVARDRDVLAESIARRRVGGGEFLLLGPHPARAHEDVGRAGVGAPIIVVIGPDNGRVARDRDGVAKVIVLCRVGGGEFLLLGPHPARAREDVGRAGVAAPVGVGRSPDDGRVARDRDGPAEAIVRRCVNGVEFRLLGPRHARAREDGGRAGVGAPRRRPYKPQRPPCRPRPRRSSRTNRSLQRRKQ